MKNLSTSKTAVLSCALALGAISSSASAFAQQPRTVKVTVPFAFEEGSKERPAGTYIIEMPSEHLMMIRDASYKSGRFDVTEPEIRSTAPQVSKVVFHRYGSHYFLHEVWLAGDTTGHACLKTRAEKQLQVAENPATPTGTEVALNVLPQ